MRLVFGTKADEAEKKANDADADASVDNHVRLL